MHFSTPLTKTGEHMELSSNPFAQGRAVAPHPLTKKVTPELWQQACQRAADDLDPDIALTVEQDVHYFYGSDQQGTTAILISSLFEVLRDRALDRHKIELPALIQDLRIYLSSLA
jgi:hypothetical protein